MGLFSKTPKAPPQPLPTVQLHLASDQETIFKPNDIVSGHVVITTPIPVHQVQALEVSLWGNSKTWIREESSNSNKSTDYRHYRDNAPLFTVTHDAFIPPPDQKRISELLPGQEYHFPFQFRVPDGTANNRTGLYKDDKDSRWTVFPHVLPPTFFWGRNPEYPDQASVDYGITAQLICPSLVIERPKPSFFSGEWAKEPVDPLSCSAPILFQPLNLHANVPGPNTILRHSKSFTLQSTSLTGAEPSSIGFRQRMHDRFSSSTPKLDFEVGIEVPDLLFSGSEFKFRTTFHVLNKTESVSHIPAIRFDIKEIKLLDFTFLRAPRDWQASNTMSGYRRKHWVNEPSPGSSRYHSESDRYSENKTLLNSVPEFATLHLAEIPTVGEKDRKGTWQEERCETWFAARVPGFTAPSFTSWAISRCYRVKIKTVIAIGEKDFKHDIEVNIKHLGSADTLRTTSYSITPILPTPTQGSSSGEKYTFQAGPSNENELPPYKHLVGPESSQQAFDRKT